METLQTQIVKFEDGVRRSFIPFTEFSFRITYEQRPKKRDIPKVDGL